MSVVFCLQVPQGHVWLQGDNVVNSTDSRNYGPVPAALVKGKVVYRVSALVSNSEKAANESAWHKTHTGLLVGGCDGGRRASQSTLLCKRQQEEPVVQFTLLVCWRKVHIGRCLFATSLGCERDQLTFQVRFLRGAC